jgi:DedD protein
VESRIKERLTGALILVAALVILVPEIFSGRHVAGRVQANPPAAPASDGPPLRTYTAELDAAAPPPLAQAAAPGAESAPEAEPVPAPAVVSNPPAHVAAPAPARTPQAAVPAPKAAPAPVHSNVAAQPAPAPGGDWYVQVGSFSQDANAQKYAQQLRGLGYAVVVLPPAGAKSLSRVRVGPARTRDAAAQVLERLTASGHKGAVVGP